MAQPWKARALSIEEEALIQLKRAVVSRYSRKTPTGRVVSHAHSLCYKDGFPCHGRNCPICHPNWIKKQVYRCFPLFQEAVKHGYHLRMMTTTVRSIKGIQAQTIVTLFKGPRGAMTRFSRRKEMKRLKDLGVLRLAIIVPTISLRGYHCAHIHTAFLYPPGINFDEHLKGFSQSWRNSVHATCLSLGITTGVVPSLKHGCKFSQVWRNPEPKQILKYIFAQDKKYSIPSILRDGLPGLSLELSQRLYVQSLDAWKSRRASSASRRLYSFRRKKEETSRHATEKETPKSEQETEAVTPQSDQTKRPFFALLSSHSPPNGKTRGILLVNTNSKTYNTKAK